MAPIDFTDDQNTMRRSLRLYFYTSNTKTNVKDITLETLLSSLLHKKRRRNLVGGGLHLLGKNMWFGK